MARFRNFLIRSLVGTNIPRAVKIIVLTVFGIQVVIKVVLPLVTGSCPDATPMYTAMEIACGPCVTCVPNSQMMI